MQDWDALKYFLINLALHNLVLVLLAIGVGVVLGRVLFARSAQGLIQLRERLSGEVEKAEKAETELEKQIARHEELREQIESGEGGTIVINSPELEKEVEELRARATETILERMMEANAALEAVAKLSEQKEEEKSEEAEELEGVKVELGSLQQEVEELRDERGETTAKMAELRGALEAAETANKDRKAKVGKEEAAQERIAVLEMQLLEARGERKQVEDASAILRKELYGMRHELKGVEKKEHLEKELNEALIDAETRLGRLQAQVAAGMWKKNEAMIPPGKAPPVDEEEVVRRSVEDEVTDDDDDEPELRGKAPASEIPAVVRKVAQVRVVEEVAEDEPEKVVEVPAVESPTGAEQDDLTRIRGVGAILAKRLNEAGMTTFRQIAEWSEEEVGTMSEKLALLNRVKQGDWQAQARALHLEVHGEEL